MRVPRDFLTKGSCFAVSYSRFSFLNSPLSFHRSTNTLKLCHLPGKIDTSPGKRPSFKHQLVLSTFAILRFSLSFVPKKKKLSQKLSYNNFFSRCFIIIILSIILSFLFFFYFNVNLVKER